MSLLVNVSLDTESPEGVGGALAAWFDAALSGPLAELMGAVRAGSAWLSAESQTTEDEPAKKFAVEADGWEVMRSELLDVPECADVMFFRYGRERPSAHVEGSSIMFRRPNMNLQLWLGDEEAPYTKVAFSSAVVYFLVGVLDSVNPAFGSVVVDEPITEEANLDAVLRRKLWRSVAAARRQLRGYSWITVCPGELADKLGGVSYLQHSGAFHKVIPLSAGGVVLQASPTPAGYIDGVMRRVFDVLAPVLPGGTPWFEPARPKVRYVPEDAASRGGQ
ncbi:hypothetical protein [Streptomyces abyssomicinicus]|uniref:hypothetical protein n=1 Tax=Streptomyces abyssomicinicus TaxID=574929 RepID=UPI00125066F9|nr:hypothetical protein [Streptomyces abyssomicinicus]